LKDFLRRRPQLPRHERDIRPDWRDFKEIELVGEPKVRVGIVGEIYVKYAPLGNNNLEQFLLDEGAEPVVPGSTDSSF
jgi:predicted nucleotide-binding protein (sugar kinase/HSP70/actin superfamily)